MASRAQSRRRPPRSLTRRSLAAVPRRARRASGSRRTRCCCRVTAAGPRSTGLARSSAGACARRQIGCTQS
eukprot:2434252-Prymnesium_polylepis.2